MFTAKVYRIMVGSLSGAMEEVYVAKETIRKWNQQNAERTGKVFMPIEWSTTPEAIQNVDLVVGVIDNWVDNPKFIEGCVNASKQVLLFFNRIQDPTNTISGEKDEVEVLRNRIHPQIACIDYLGIIQFSELLNNQLESTKA